VRASVGDGAAHRFACHSRFSTHLRPARHFDDHLCRLAHHCLLEARPRHHDVWRFPAAPPLTQHCPLPSSPSRAQLHRSRTPSSAHLARDCCCPRPPIHSRARACARVCVPRRCRALRAAPRARRVCSVLHGRQRAPSPLAPPGPGCARRPLMRPCPPQLFPDAVAVVVEVQALQWASRGVARGGRPPRPWHARRRRKPVVRGA
jgi:hypothetical protein